MCPRERLRRFMTYPLLFTLINVSVLPAWALLIFLPQWKGTKFVVHSAFYPLLLGVVYIVCFALALSGHGAGGSFNSIEGVRELFSSDVGIIIGWAHYLVFDLFIGAWESRDAQRRGFSHWLLVPCLLLTFMAGPVGLLLYLVLRAAMKKGGWAVSVVN